MSRGVSRSSWLMASGMARSHRALRAPCRWPRRPHCGSATRRSRRTRRRRPADGTAAAEEAPPRGPQRPGAFPLRRPIRAEDGSWRATGGPPAPGGRSGQRTSPLTPSSAPDRRAPGPTSTRSTVDRVLVTVRRGRRTRRRNVGVRPRTRDSCPTIPPLELAGLTLDEPATPLRTVGSPADSLPRSRGTGVGDRWPPRS